MEISTPSIKNIFERDGFYILKNAIPTELADKIRGDMHSFDETNGYIGLLNRMPFIASQAHTHIEKFRFKDLHINNSNIRSAIFSEEITHIINQILNGSALAFQSLGFIKSTGIRIHRDSNYVSIKDPQPKVVACWLALEDITEETGPIKYYPRSHTLEKYLFADGNDHWIRSDHGIFANEDCHRWNEEQMKNHGISGELFLAKKGDCVFWDFDLVHEATRPTSNQTRYSIATHFCPSNQTPAYLAKSGLAKPIKHTEKIFFSSNHYLLNNINSSLDLLGHPIKPNCT